MNIWFTLHAIEQMERRKIHTIWVEETIKFPDIIKMDNFKYHAIKKLNGKTLKVIYLKEKSIKVITAFYVK